MGQARVDPVDHARLIVLGHLTTECCKASMSAKAEVMTMSEEIAPDERRFHLDGLIRPRNGSFDNGCATGDERSVLATILVMIICVVLSVAIVNWSIFH
jgi:hypothetical protein